MRKLFWLLGIILADSFCVSGQLYDIYSSRYYDSYASRMFVDFDYKPGAVSEKIKSGSLTSNYANAVNASASDLVFNNGKSNAYNLGVGIYLDKNRTIGIGVGISYAKQEGTLNVDSFHVEYSATDYKGNIFRQLITAPAGISETVKATNISIPFYVCYRRKLVQDMLFAAYAGILYNSQMQYSYSTSSTFNYEAIYKFQVSGGNLSYSYDNAPTPGGNDWLITQAEFNKVNSQGDMTAYFAHMQSTGYNVGLDQTVNAKSGQIAFKQNSIGYFVQAGVNYLITDRFFGKVGLYFSSQSFKNSAVNQQMLVSPTTGTYISLMNYVTQVNLISYGVSFGVGYYFLK